MHTCIYSCVHKYIYTYVLLTLTYYLMFCSTGVRLSVMSWFLVVAVPGEPSSIAITERMPNSIIIDVEPPLEDGGEEVTGYHVEYEEKAQEFRAGREENSCALSVK